MRALMLIFVCIILTSISGCSAFFRAPVVPPTASVFTDIECPIDVNFNNTTIGPKKGMSQSVGILGLLAFGDASVKAAAQEGNITTVDHIGYKFTNILGIVSFYKTIAYGQ